MNRLSEQVYRMMLIALWFQIRRKYHRAMSNVRPEGSLWLIAGFERAILGVLGMVVMQRKKHANTAAAAAASPDVHHLRVYLPPSLSSLAQFSSGLSANKTKCALCRSLLLFYVCIRSSYAHFISV